MMKRFCDLCNTEIGDSNKKNLEYVAIGLTFYLDGELREFAGDIHPECTPESFRELVALKGKSQIKESDPRTETGGESGPGHPGRVYAMAEQPQEERMR